MKLLIITQKVDFNDPVLGFFHRWIRVFSTQYDKVYVICLERGEYDLPANVQVLSLGKETGRSRLKYLYYFYKYIWQLRREYQAVFVHMNQEYILLAGLIWRLWHKRVALWYNHSIGGWKTDLAAKLSQVVFHTSPYAYTAKFSNACRMSAGIDLKLFRPKKIKRQPDSILYVGRIDPIKGVHILLESNRLLREKGIETILHIYGDASVFNQSYLDQLKKSATDGVEWYPAVPNNQTPDLYRSHTVFVNLTPAGNYDKTVLEAMACGAVPVVASAAFADIIPAELRPVKYDSADVADCLEYALGLADDRREQLSVMFREYVSNYHTLETLGLEIYRIFNE